MKTLLFTLVLSFFSLNLFSQTKLIAHKSSGGTSKDFHLAMKNRNGIPSSNYGHAPMRIIKTARLDTLEWISDSVVVMKTSNTCRYTDNIGHSDVWNPGSDTLYHHQLFSEKEKLDSIKSVINDQYNFQNPVDSMVFIGYGPELIDSCETPEITIDFSYSQPLQKEDSPIRKNSFLRFFLFGICLVVGGLMVRRFIS